MEQLLYGTRVRVKAGVFTGWVGRIVSESQGKYLIAFAEDNGLRDSPSPQWLNRQQFDVMDGGQNRGMR